METSCGVVLVNFGSILLLQYPQGHWDFPKGHIEDEDVDHMATAARELAEETGISDIEFIFSVGGDDKKNSSSWILKNWQYYFEERVWGSFYNLFEKDHVKVKELIVNPGQGMSFQKHFKRNEIWLVSKGSCVVNYSEDDPDNRESITLKTFDNYTIPLGKWHQITNPFKETCHIIEIQYGKEVAEGDIERLDYYKP